VAPAKGRSEATGESAQLDTARVAAAQAYVNALADHRADDVPFAPDCTRVEVGIKTGFSGNHLRRSLNRGVQYRIIEKTTPPEFTAVDDGLRARFNVVTKPTLAGRRVCAHIDETFVFTADGKIRHIRASIRPFIQR
jgi:hypothetical protein